jgi:hypothetical protein
MNAETFHIKAFHIKDCHIETDPVPARLKRLPLRLRLAHLAALIRGEAEGSPRAGALKHLLTSMNGGRAG